MDRTEQYLRDISLYLKGIDRSLVGINKTLKIAFDTKTVKLPVIEDAYNKLNEENNGQ